MRPDVSGIVFQEAGLKEGSIHLCASWTVLTIHQVRVPGYTADAVRKLNLLPLVMLLNVAHSMERNASVSNTDGGRGMASVTGTNAQHVPRQHPPVAWLPANVSIKRSWRRV